MRRISELFDDRRNRKMAVIGLLVAMACVVGLWALNQDTQGEKDDAVQETANTKEDLGELEVDAQELADRVLAICAEDTKQGRALRKAGACPQAQEVQDTVETNDLDPDDPELQDAEVQDAEEQDPELQEPEIQDDEIQDPETQDPENQDPEVADGEVDDPEIQDDEIQDPENQDPENQDPETDDPDPNSLLDFQVLDLCDNPLALASSLEFTWVREGDTMTLVISC